MRILVLGGTGVISRAIIREGLKAGHEMISLNRGTHSVHFEEMPEIIRCDWRDDGAYRKATEGLQVDAVIDVLSMSAADAKHTMEDFGGAAKHWIFTSTSCAYKKPFAHLPVRECETQRWDDPAYGYPTAKAGMERYLLEECKGREAPVTVIRPSLTYGEGSQNIGILRQNVGILRRIESGKPLLLYDDGQTVFTYTFAPDLARGYLACCLNPRAYGEDFHITSENHASKADMYRVFGRMVGKEPKFAYLPSAKFFEIDPQQFEHIWYEKRFPHIFSIEKIRTACPEWKPEIDLETGLRQIAQWWEKEGMQPDPAKDALEDELIAKYASK